ncbi:MAG: DNA polymerase, partial [Christensenellales bacterium]
MNNNANKIILIDSNSLVNRAFHALPPLQLVDGTYTNAIFGYISMLQKLIVEEKPTHVCAIFDCRAKTFRHKMYSGYKATRKPMAEELAAQIPLLKDLLSAMGIKILFKEGAEADDIIGTLAKRFSDETVIVTGDRDCLQLVDDTTTVFLTKRGVSDVTKFTPQELMRVEGFTPEQIIEYKGLAGDSSDNIPGAPGVGQKTATDLLHKYGDIDGVYANIDDICGKMKQKLIDNKELVYLSKKLATIDTDVEIECNLSELSFGYPLPSEAYDIMKKLDFRKLIDRFDFEKDDEKTLEKQDFDVEKIAIGNEEELKKAVESIAEGSNVAICWEQDVCFSDGKQNYDVNFTNDLFGTGLSEDAAIEIVKPLFSEKYHTVMFDVKNVMTIFYGTDCDVELPYEDVSLKAYLLSPGRSIKDVRQLLNSYGYPCKNIASELLKLNDELDMELKKHELKDLYDRVELPLIKCLFDMERVGFRVDKDVLEDLDKCYTEEIERLVEEIYRLAGEEFNVNSNKQLAYILFEKLGLP